MGRRYKKKKNDNVTGLMTLFIIFLVYSLGNGMGIGLGASILIGIVIMALGSSYIKYKDQQRYMQSGIQDIDKMSGEEFEKCLLHHFNKLGYQAETTSKSHDYGADLILKKYNEKIIVQAKRYNKPVGIKAIQQALGAMAYYRANRCFVVTNNYFTANAKNLAEKCNVELWDRNTIIQTFTLNEESNGNVKRW